ncbi:MAG TPA: amidoligase family protein, partial [Paracoccaceae bacterium]|nr:amidoligase family protein [Paracoccaceae bacterium]
VLPVPVEMITPPLQIQEFEILDHAIAALREAGATGTEGGAFHAFGLHLNPELQGGAARAIRIAAVYAFAESWLRQRNPPDMARRLSPFVNVYPEAYVLALARAFETTPPGLTDFLVLYAEHNPDRNHGLDLWPLLGWLAPEAAEAAYGKPIKNPRPAFHYRLPDSLLGDAEWSPRADLERWLAIERAADDPTDFERLRAAAEGAATAQISRDDYLREAEAVLG